MTVWSTIESMVRTALANAATAPNHVAWLDAMANVPYGALNAAIEEIDQLRKDNLDATTEGWRKNAEVAALRDAAVALGKANDQVDRLTKALGERDQVIAAMTESSQRIIDHAVQARARMAPLATFPVVTRIKPSVCDTNPMEAEHPTSNEPRPRVRLSVDRRVIDDAVLVFGRRGGKLHDLVARTPEGGVFVCTTALGKRQVAEMCALQGRFDIRVVMADDTPTWGMIDAKVYAERSASEGDGVD